LNIKNVETEQLARELARRRGTGITEAVTHALRNEVERERKRRRRKGSEEFVRKVQEIVEEVRKLPILDHRSDDEIVGYNDQGHFD
jgi:antitoxin VapB